MTAKMLSCSGSFHCLVCGRSMKAIVMTDPDTNRTWRQCICCDTREPNIQREEMEDEKT